MRTLIPVDFAALGMVEWLWLAFAGLGLSFLAPDGRWRVKTAVWLAVVAALVAGMRLVWFRLDEQGQSWQVLPAWQRWGPLVTVPPFVAALVLGGGWVPRGLGVPVLGLPLLILTFMGRPFGGAGFSGWLFLAFLGFALAAFVQGEGPLRALLARRIGPLRGSHLFALAFLFFCGLAAPLGVGWAGALAILALFWLVGGVLSQGPEMRRYVRRRLLGAPLVLIILLLLSFILIRSAPGGPFSREKNIDPALLEIKRQKYHMDRPLWVQFAGYIANLTWDGDLGDSFKQKGRTINEIIERHAGPSIRLGLAALALAILLGVTSGIVAGIRQNSIFDYASMAGAMLGLALPTFIVGPILVYAFAIELKWFQVSGWEEIWFPFPRDLILPAITLSLPFAARLARLTRAGMLEIINQDYIRTARAKGLSEPAIVIRHTLKGAFLPVIAFLGPAVALVLTGSLVVEKIFGVPGLGREFVESATNRDYPLALGLVLLFGALLVVFNLVVDIAYAFLDPRIRHA